VGRVLYRSSLSGGPVEEVIMRATCFALAFFLIAVFAVGSEAFDRRLFVRLADEAIIGIDQTYSRMNADACSRSGTKLDKSAIAAYLRLDQAFPNKDIAGDKSAAALKQAISDVNVKMDSWCTLVRVFRSADADKTMKEVSVAKEKAHSLLRAYYKSAQ